jgi:indolepyruvate ferredoxin oxidoreductase beta subunit
LSARARQVAFVQGLDIARELGNVRVTNTVLLGALSALLPIDAAIWEQVILQRVPDRYAELNRKAFRLGQEQLEVK